MQQKNLEPHRLPKEYIEIYAQMATKPSIDHESDYVVIGKLINDDKNSYEYYAQRKNCIHFFLDEWNDIDSKYGELATWDINQKFLEMQIDKGRKFLCTHNPDGYSGSTYEKEINFLRDNQFCFAKKQAKEIWPDEEFEPDKELWLGVVK